MLMSCIKDGEEVCCFPFFPFIMLMHNNIAVGVSGTANTVATDASSRPDLPSEVHV